jgi:serine/threonine protein kinase
VTVVQEPQYPSGLSYDAVSFMMQALDKNPQKRPTVKQLLAHPWVDRLAQQQQQQQQQQAQQQQLSHLQ